MQRNKFTLLFYKIEVVKFLDDQAGDDICKDYHDSNVKKVLSKTAKEGQSTFSVGCNVIQMMHKIYP